MVIISEQAISSGSGVDSTASEFVNPQDLLCRQQFDEEFLPLIRTAG